jgi:hypothetical protein
MSGWNPNALLAIGAAGSARVRAYPIRESGVIMKMSTVLCLLSAMLLCLGCDGGSDSSVDQTPTNTVQDTWDGTPHTNKIFITGSHMFEGQEASVVVDLYSNVHCSVTLVGSNDGDSDHVGVFVIDNNDRYTIGAYQTFIERKAGLGWYIDHESPVFQFTPTTNRVTIGVHILEADEWGTWPKYFVLVQSDTY